MSITEISGYNFSGDSARSDYAAISAAKELISENSTVMLFGDMDASFRQPGRCYIYAGQRVDRGGLSRNILSQGFADRRSRLVGAQ